MMKIYLLIPIAGIFGFILGAITMFITLMVLAYIFF